MIEIKILKPDGSVYWQMLVDSVSESERWVAEEKTRPYWKAGFTVVLTDKSPPPPTQAEVDAIAADLADMNANKSFLKGLKQSDLTDVASCARAIMKIIKHLRADK
jgi:hypothetical protein